MKKLSKLVLIILVLSLCCTVLCGFAVGNKKLQETIENQTEHFAGGSGTESDPYQISTAKQLQKLSDIINLDYPNKYQNAYREAYYKLTANIDLGGKKSPWTPIGSPDTNSPGFYGHFDGDGHTISGIYIKCRDGLTKDKRSSFGLFGEINKGSVKNLTIKDSYIEVDSENAPFVGTIAGRISDTLIENCHVLGDVEISSSYEAGGLVGRVSGDETGKISNCSNAARVSGIGSVSTAGGIAAWCSADIENCKNSGNITADDAAGGIAACIVECDVSGCRNSGDIKAEYAGGIAADFSTSSFVNSGVSEASYIKDCANIGNIDGEVAGGLIAKMDCGGKYGGAIIGCQNSGTVTAKSELDSDVGGIVSSVQISAEAGLSVKDCKNTGKLIIEGDEDDSNAGTVGGIVAYISTTKGSVEIIGCENSVDISNRGVCGGILGDYIPGPAGDEGKQTDIKISDCKNSGDIYGSFLGVGGIMGVLNSFESSNVRLIITDCVNSGNLEADGFSARLGGILAVIEPAGAGCEIMGCVNEGTLTPGKVPESAKIIGKVSSALGGIIGLVGESSVDPALPSEAKQGPNAGPIVISGCENKGKLVTHEDVQYYYTDDMLGLSYVDAEIK